MNKTLSKREIQIKQKLAHLQWKKMRTENQMQNMMHTSKRLHERDTMMKIANNRGYEKQKWMDYIIKDELNKPLEVTDKWMESLTSEKVKDKQRARTVSKNQIRNIQKLQKDQQERECVRERNRRYIDEKQKLVRQFNISR